jgi:putative transposase
LLAEWDRCRWVWNECVARSKKAHTEDETCGPARLDKMLTEARARTRWLTEGSSVPQQQLVRDFGKARAKALKDIKDRLPIKQRAGMPRHKRKREAERWSPVPRRRD